jgi:hypothetical protein
MAGRIPMKGDPPPLDRARMGADLKASTLRMRDELATMIADAEREGDAILLKELCNSKKKIDKLVAGSGLDRAE